MLNVRRREFITRGLRTGCDARYSYAVTSTQNKARRH